MGERTGISWTDATWNPWQGCHKVSAGCKNCYMVTEKKRFGQKHDVVIRSSDATFNAPLKWTKNREKYAHINLVFVCSWSDFFIKEADALRDEAWAIIRATPNLTYQICTKRPERIAACLPADWGAGYPNVWLMVTAENQRMADLRIPILLSIPAAVHGVSVEPMIGPVRLDEVWPRSLDGVVLTINALSGTAEIIGSKSQDIINDDPENAKLAWVICGGESGPKARPMHADWARSLRDQCMAAGISFFFKQWGEWLPGIQYEDKHRAMDSDDAQSRFPCMDWDGEKFFDSGGGWGDDLDEGAVFRVGKQAAGAMLDGREWKKFPGWTA